MPLRRRLYIETLIHCDLDELWQRTQQPAAHERWDLRFSRIECLPRADPIQPQQLRYTRWLLPGVSVTGTGVSISERDRPDGSRASALRFISTSRLSLLRSGSGYWRYLPTVDGIRFVTGYDYRPGWGRGGGIADRLFRPVLGWATAWSFDRLRLWLEKGISPEAALRRALLDAVGRAAGCVGAWYVLPGAFTALCTITVLVLPPLRATPAARRCRRRPPDRHSATVPVTLSTME